MKRRVAYGLVALLTLVGCLYAWGFCSDIIRSQSFTGGIDAEALTQETRPARDTRTPAAQLGSTLSFDPTPTLAVDASGTIEGGWYVSPSSIITDHSDCTTPGSLAWVLAMIGSAHAPVVLLPGTYLINGDITVPSSATLYFWEGAELKISVGRTITVDSPDNLFAGPIQRIFTGAGRVVFLRPGTVMVGWWGADQAGVSDSWAAITAAVGAAAVGGTVKFQGGTYLVGGGITVNKGINLVGEPGYGTVLKACPTLTGLSMITYAAQHPHADLRRIEHLKLDGGDVAENGLEIKQGYGLTIANVGAHHFKGAGFYVNGDSNFITPGYGPLIYVINFDTCSSNDNRYGYHLHKNCNRTAFAQFTFTQSGAYVSKEAGLWLHGDNATTCPNLPAGRYSGFDARWTGGQIEVTRYGGDSIRVTNGVNASFHGIYLEPDYDSFRRYANGYVLHGGSSVEVESSMVSFPNTIDGNSTLCASNSLLSYAFGVGSKSPLTRACIGDRISDKLTHGPPNFPSMSQSHGSGFIGTKGIISVDAMGTRWLDTQTGKSEQSRWVPMDGRVIVPFDYRDAEAGAYKVLFWAQENFVITAVDVIIDRTFMVDGEGIAYCAGIDSLAGIAVGTMPHRNKFISQTDGAYQNMTSGRVIRANANVHPENVLGGNKAYLARGSSVSSYLQSEARWATNYEESYVTIFFCPNVTTGNHWTAGSGYVVIYGYPLKFN